MSSTTIKIPSRYGGHENGTSTRSRSSRWTLLEMEYHSEGEVVVPDWLFDPRCRVPDEGAYTIGANCVLARTPCAAIKPGGVILLLESPHKDEFEGPKGRARWPLQNEQVRADLESKVPTLLRSAAKETGMDLTGKQLALVNAIQYQMSLHSLMKSWASKLVRPVRNCVWKAVYAAGGAEDMLRRIDSYHPDLVLLAPTADVRKPFLASLRAAGPGWRSYRISAHPSGWFACDPKLCEQSHDEVLVA